ncbi:MAG: oligoendopeptidase F [Candidatus Krumholzibacteria bacterium]|nr:oligoendopeptidase F [Candidatus Krumholzibacteria bacterium]
MSHLGLCRKAGLITLLTVISCLLLSTTVLADYEPNPSAARSDIPADYQWNSSDIFPDYDAWKAELEAIGGDIPKLMEFQGRLGESAATMLDAQNSTHEMMVRLYKLYVYAQTLYDVDQGNNDHRQMQGQVSALFPSFGEATSWMEPELLEIDPTVIKNFMAEEEDLAVYSYYFSELWRQQEHTLSSPEERLMALTGNMRSVPSDAHEALLGVDMEFPDITDGEGNPIPMTVSGFSGLRSDESYEIRLQARDVFFGTLRNYETTFAVLLDGVVKSHIMSKDARGYDNCLEASLSPDNISTGAYRMLIDTVREKLPTTMHKYVSLRRKVMGLDEPLTFPNLYNAMIEGVEPNYTYADAQVVIAKGLKPLGEEYVGLLTEGMDPANGWIDIYPNENKRSGAYSNGVLAKEIHPYVLHNFDNTLDAVSTTAHELGHALHSVYSSRNQPPIYAGYTTFLAEIASTCNEALLTNYLLDQADDVDVKLMLLNQRLESIRLTIFRQTLFADFELRFHEHAEAGNPLTAEFLNNLYADMIREYYGPEFELGEDDECEWMFIPHFYYNFYVFTYATGLTSGLALADEISENGDEAAQRYINNMLKAGSSAPPLEILRNAGVDLETPAPIISAMEMFEQTIDEFDKLWTKKYGDM